MATWVPNCAPNLWGHPPWGCPSCSCAMHAVYPWNAILMGLNASSGSLLVLHLNGLFTLRTWTLRDLGFPLLKTGVLSGIHFSWSSFAVWIIVVRCHFDLTLLSRTHRHILVIDVLPLVGILAGATCGTVAHAACGSHLTWPTITSSQQCPRTGRYKNLLETRLFRSLELDYSTWANVSPFDYNLMCLKNTRRKKQMMIWPCLGLLLLRLL